MTKIKILADRVIFDGHAETREECETITLLCDSLANNPNFKTVRYESGYAEFEKIGEARELKFTPAICNITMIFDSHITAVNSRSPMTVSWTTSGENQITAAIDGTTYTFDVTLSSEYVLDTVSLSESDESCGKLTEKTDTTFSILAGSGGIAQIITITSKAAAPTISFRHLYSGGTIGSEVVKFKAYTQTYLPQLATPTNVSVSGTTASWDEVANAESYDVYVDNTLYENTTGAVTPTGETWVLNERFQLITKLYYCFDSAYEPDTAIISFVVKFSSNGQIFSKLVGSRVGPDPAIDSSKAIQVLEKSTDAWVSETYRTITFASAPTGDLLTWLQANGTKQ